MKLKAYYMLDKITAIVKNLVFLWATFWAIITGSLAYMPILQDFVSANVSGVISTVALGALLTIIYIAHYNNYRKRVEHYAEIATSINKLTAMSETNGKAITDLLNESKCAKLSRDQMRIKFLKLEVDLLFRHLRNNSTITEDEAKYLYELDKTREELGINSFTARKLNCLKHKEITYK